jgi:hypothetical protein
MNREERISTGGWGLRYLGFVMGKGRVKEFIGIWPPKPDADLVEFTKMTPGGSDS